MKTVTFHGFANGKPPFAEVMHDAYAESLENALRDKGVLPRRRISAKYDIDRDDRGRVLQDGQTVAHFTVNTLTFYLLPRQ